MTCIVGQTPLPGFGETEHCALGRVQTNGLTSQIADNCTASDEHRPAQLRRVQRHPRLCALRHDVLPVDELALDERGEEVRPVHRGPQLPAADVHRDHVVLAAVPQQLSQVRQRLAGDDGLEVLHDGGDALAHRHPEAVQPHHVRPALHELKCRAGQYLAGVLHRHAERGLVDHPPQHSPGHLYLMLPGDLRQRRIQVRVLPRQVRPAPAALHRECEAVVHTHGHVAVHQPAHHLCQQPARRDALSRFLHRRGHLRHDGRPLVRGRQPHAAVQRHDLHALQHLIHRPVRQCPADTLQPLAQFHAAAYKFHALKSSSAPLFQSSCDNTGTA